MNLNFSTVTCGAAIVAIAIGSLFSFADAEVIDRVPTKTYLNTYPDISDDGRFVLFTSRADSLVPTDSNGWADIFLHDRNSGEIELISLDWQNQQADHSSGSPSMSGDARFIVFTTAWWMVPEDTNLKQDVYLVDRQLGLIELISVGHFGQLGNDSSYSPTVSDDGRYIAFTSHANNLTGDTDSSYELNVYVRDRVMATTTLISREHDTQSSSGESYAPKLSSNGRYIGFSSASDQLVPDDSNGQFDAFVYDQSSGILDLVSVDSSGVQGEDSSAFGSISSDGRFVAFSSQAWNFVGINPDGFVNPSNVFLFDRQERVLTAITKENRQGTPVCDSTSPILNSDATAIVFSSRADNLIAGDKNGTSDIYRYDITGGTFSRLSVGMRDQESDAGTNGFNTTADGKYIVYDSLDSVLFPDDDDGVSDLYIAENSKIFSDGLEPIEPVRCMPWRF